jgi:2-dehydro-3-deoxyphosphogluconate aldolase/(4S)-4-hydroxy-2-oxoglutarate aldolase
LTTIDKAATLERVREFGLLAVLRAPDPDGARRAVEALIEAGVTGIEITYSTPETAGVISSLREAYSDEALVGAGTVI